MQKGKVYLIGAGPGKPDLITVRGQNILKEADVIIYDYLVDRRILENAKEKTELIGCDRLDKSGNSDKILSRQKRINALLVKKAGEGKKVARLKSGDPAIFSRCSHELEALAKEGIGFEIVPGVTAASAASYSGIPLTDRRFASSCTFVTGHEDPAKTKSLVDWDSLAQSGTIVFYMAVGNLSKIAGQLIKAGKDKKTQAAIIQNASMPAQRALFGTLDNIASKAAKKKIKPPAIVIIGKTAGLGKKFKPLKREKRVLFTGLSGERFFLKDNYIHVPLIKIEPMEDYSGFDRHLKNITDFDWIVFTSRYGVEHFFRRIKKAGYDARKIAGVRIAAIGNSTKEKLMEYMIKADLVPENESSRGLIKKFKKKSLKNKKIFLPRSDIADKGLEKALKGLGAEVVPSFAYRNIMPENLPDLDINEFDEIMFTSPSTVRNFKKRYKKVPENVKVSCIGEVTLREARRCRLLS